MESAWNLYISLVVGFMPFRLTLSMLVSSLFFSGCPLLPVFIDCKRPEKNDYTKQFSFALDGMSIVIFYSSLKHQRLTFFPSAGQELHSHHRRLQRSIAITTFPRHHRPPTSTNVTTSNQLPVHIMDAPVGHHSGRDKRARDSVCERDHDRQRQKISQGPKFSGWWKRVVSQ